MSVGFDEFQSSIQSLNRPNNMKLLKVTTFLTLASLSGSVLAVINGRCHNPSTGAAYEYGVCVRTADCQAKGGYTLNGWCPSDGNGVKCCIKSDCHPTRTDDNCMFITECNRRHGQILSSE